MKGELVAVGTEILLGNILGAILGAWLHSLRRDTEDGAKHKA